MPVIIVVNYADNMMSLSLVELLNAQLLSLHSILKNFLEFVAVFIATCIHVFCTCRASSITRGDATYSIEVYVTIDGVRTQVTDMCSSCNYVVSVWSYDHEKKIM